MKTPLAAAAGLLLGTAVCWQAAQAQPAIIVGPPYSGTIIAEQPPEALPNPYFFGPPPPATAYGYPPSPAYQQPGRIEGYGSSMAPGYRPPPVSTDPDDE